MSKTKASGLIHYEILFIIPNKFTDDEAQKVFKKVGGIIVSNDGKISMEDYWGKRKFAYPINHEYYGYYGLYEFDLERNLIAKINDTLRLDKEVVRFIIVKKEVKSEEQIKKDKKIKEKIENKKNEEIENKKEEVKKEIKKTSKKKDGGEKLDLKNLDEKLEDVLNIDNLL
ncbi:30S ribosomal protein S6 [Candidatus Falkowbacteria bacterium HGW-Falkowbacteria-1]|uniref:Small ribosomal subunit protein bS6 n=1 Tax=Candidatus Falkowbacteria bacterium HGW-Falkowbacteria-1 TaxID=2013768 RepID=A0A2N2E8T4_9BACT|nr:MAG: 30S ribosomal protein S6 [Candidatus Falkowbacteria bacterium HGW-Falkowbacteria-1]